MFKVKSIPWLVCLCILGLSLTISGTASAKGGFVDPFNTRYGTNYGCDFCHPGFNTSALNPYSQDLESAYNANGKNLDSALVAIEPLDSDGDGYINSDEFSAETHPGDAQSVPEDSPPVLKMEAGQLSIKHVWTQVTLQNSYTNPVVIATALSKKGEQGATVRIRNVTSNSFEIRVQEWSYLDGTHYWEDIGYLVMEAGHYVLENGLQVEAGQLSTNKANVRNAFETVTFAEPFTTVPVVSASIMTFNGGEPVVTRKRNAGTANFEDVMQEEEAGNGFHLEETIGYVAWEIGAGTVNGLDFEVGIAGEIDHSWDQVVYGSNFSPASALMLDMQTTNGPNTANLRYVDKVSGSVQAQVIEEKSKDTEIEHDPETIGYIVIE